MTPIRCLIIDDEPPAQKILERYARDIQSLEVVAKCKNAFEAMDALRSNEIDLIFLDINMPKLSGMDFLRALPQPPLVIVTSAYQEYALEGYELDIVDYLMKPFSFERFLKAFQKAQVQWDLCQSTHVLVPTQDQIVADDAYVLVKADNSVYRVNLDEIQYVEAMGNYVKIHLKERNIVSNMSLRKMEQLLPVDQFCRVHKTYLVSLSKIVSVGSDLVVLKGKNIPLGHTYRQAFLDLVQHHAL